MENGKSLVTYGGAGVVAIVLGVGDQSELEFVVLDSRDGNEGNNWLISRWGLVRRPCHGRVVVLREENTERNICQYASLRSRLGVEAVAPNSEAFRASLAALPVVDTIL